MNNIPFFESVDPDFRETDTVGSFNSGNSKNSFDSVYTEACDSMYDNYKVKATNGFLAADVLQNQRIVSDFRTDLLRPFEESADQLTKAVADIIKNNNTNPASRITFFR